MKFWLGLILVICSLNTWAVTNSLNLYIWSNYVPQSVLDQFRKETGIIVNETNYDSNETLYAKLKANPRIGYDIIVPSSYFVQRMSQQNMLRPLDTTQLTNLKNINPQLLNKKYDPGNQFSIPYVWGTTGILVNKLYWDPQSIQNWSDLWQPRFKNQLLMLDDPREVFAIALIKLGASINSEDPQKIKQAYEELKLLMQNVKVFNTDNITNIFIDEDVTVGMNWSGESLLAIQENPNLVYIYPKDGFSMWIDCMAIPKNAPHFEAAEKFINFILRPDVAKEIIVSQGYSLPNTEAIKMLPPSLKSNPVLNPSPEILKRGVLQLDVGPAISTYQNFWQILKLGATS